MSKRKRNSDALLYIISSEKLQQGVAKAVKGLGKTPCVYISLNRSWKSAEKALKSGHTDTKRVCFIDCVNVKSEKGVMHVPPTQLSKLAYAIKCFVDAIRGEKFIVIDSLSTLLIYNDANKVACFAKSVTDYAAQNDVSVIAFSPKTKGEELLGKIYNFFDEVKQR